jgi:hypothetical protein
VPAGGGRLAAAGGAGRWGIGEELPVRAELVGIPRSYHRVGNGTGSLGLVGLEP